MFEVGCGFGEVAVPGSAAAPAAPLAASVAEVLAWAERDWDGAAVLEEGVAGGGLAEVVPDLDADPGDGVDAWEAGEGAEWARAAAGEEGLPAGLRGCFPAGLCPRDDGVGAGFAAGGVADRLVPGVVLAGLAGDVWAAGLGRVSDDELIGVLRGWHRLGSWAAAGELAVVTELAGRRSGEVAAGADPHLAEHVGDELAVSLTLTGRAADGLLDFAAGLARLPLTAAALAGGVIDRGRAWVIADELSLLDPGHARVVEARVIGRAGRQTSGQLRAAAWRAVLAVDPAAAKRRCEKARTQARVETWDERSGGTAGLAGRDLPPADVLAADHRIDILARHLRAAGAEGTLDQLRARVYVALLLGHPTAPSPATPASRDLNPDNPDAHDSGAGDPGPGEPGPGTPPTTGKACAAGTPAGGGTATAPAGGIVPPALLRAGGVTGVGDVTGARGAGVPGGHSGSVNLTMPLSAWLGATAAPGEVAGFGPIPASDARALAHLAAAHPGSRWCLTFTDQHGHAVAHGCATRPPASRRAGKAARTGSSPASGEPGTSPPTETAGPPGDWELAVTIRPIATSTCTHPRETASYRPPASLYHVVNIRQRTCSFPGCRRQAAKCDLDHTIPHHKGGRTCECNMAPLCRRHHRAKQTQGWHLDQPQPGILIWRLPHGRTYRTEPDPYPEE